MGARSAIGVAVAALVTVSVLSPPASSAAELESTRALASRLRAAGRAQVRVTQTGSGESAPGGARSGTLALEVPDRVRLDYPATGERLTVRGDGGEWLQPAQRQLLVLHAEHAAEASRLWRLLMAGRAEDFTERRLGPRRWLLAPRTAGSVDSAWITLAPGGLPSRLEVRAADGERLTFAFRGWSFGRPRGTAAFTLRAPPGYSVVALP
jgi:outer membrane lipoprotein-sorting protein